MAAVDVWELLASFLSSFV